MLLTIDIGNSSSKFGLFEGERLTKHFAINTAVAVTANDIFSEVETRLPDELEAIVISSVVGKVRESFDEFGTRFFGVAPIFVDHTFDFGFSIKYFPPKDCGSDRLVAAYAAKEKFGTPLIVCDFGTATTIDFVNERNEYIGGIITPGPDTLGAALFEKTSKLPKVEFEKPETVTGNSTVSSIQSGIYFGYIGLVDGIIERMMTENLLNPKVISTGGFAKLIAEESKFVEIVEENLILEGLHLIHNKSEPNTQ